MCHLLVSGPDVRNRLLKLLRKGAQFCFNGLRADIPEAELLNDVLPVLVVDADGVLELVPGLLLVGSQLSNGSLHISLLVAKLFAKSIQVVDACLDQIRGLLVGCRDRVLQLPDLARLLVLLHLKVLQKGNGALPLVIQLVQCSLCRVRIASDVGSLRPRGQNELMHGGHPSVLGSNCRAKILQLVLLLFHFRILFRQLVAEFQHFALHVAQRTLHLTNLLCHWVQRADQMGLDELLHDFIVFCRKLHLWRRHGNTFQLRGVAVLPRAPPSVGC
mmetsp:Transcript_12814/g.30489  ORF Transcript_12814/g.30489 Transcript_12814/m.30489 type:complete len:274 (-) Transcript_12814:145-966(-)